MWMAKEGLIYHEDSGESVKDFSRERFNQNCILDASLA